jgi:uncharacterized protein (TIGR02757 family)
MLSKARAERLKPVLDGFLRSRDWKARVQFDPIEFPGRYVNPRDVEVAGLLGAALAYGRADLFKPKVDGLLSQMGASPADYVSSLTVPRAAKLLDGFVYRFNLAADLGVLLMGMGRALRELGSLEALFLEGPVDSLHGSLAHFTGGIRERAPLGTITARLGKTRGLHHLLPHPLGEGAAKRMNLYLRWMARPRDGIDFGVWTKVSPSRLMIPLDTHVMRISRLLGLTSRQTLNWRTAEEVTSSLRLLDADDPVRYDFALCHYGMSGVCPSTPVRENCVRCELRVECRVGRARR